MDDHTTGNRQAGRNIYIVMIVAVTLLLFIIHIFFILLPDYRNSLYDKKKEVLEELSSSVFSLLDHYYQEVKTGEMSPEQAKAEAVHYIKGLRYGPKMKDYFWINDFYPRMIMHPYQPELDGSDLSFYEDPTGRKLFVEAVDIVRKNGEGYIEYLWQWQDDPNRVERKLSFVKQFEPWGWIVGSGIYLADMETEIDAITRKTYLISLGILFTVTLFSILVVHFNIKTERNRLAAEKSLIRSELRFRETVELLPEIVFEIDRNGKLIFVNKAALEKTGYDLNDLSDSFNVLSLFMPEDLGRAQTNMQKVLNGEIAVNSDYLIRRKDGGILPVYIRSARIVHDGKVSGVRGVIVDMTDIKNLEKEYEISNRHLAQADKMTSLGILVSGVAHEINNPNNYIMLNGKMLIRVWDDITPILAEYYEENGDFPVAGIPYSKARDKIKRLIEGIPEGAGRIQKIVQGLKEFARNDPGEKSNDVDINAVVDSSVTIVRNLINKKTKHFSFHYGENIPLIEGNFQQLEQVVINLLTNAAQALPDPQKSIEIETAFDPDNNTVTIIVRDEGVGILQDDLKHVMDPFYTTKREAEGTGLGLSISYRFIQEHNGNFTLDSEPGRGTTAVITLPAAKGGS